MAFVAIGGGEPEAVEVVFIEGFISEPEMTEMENDSGIEVVGLELRLSVRVVRLSIVTLVGIKPLAVDRLVDEREVPLGSHELLTASVLMLDFSIVELVSEPVFGPSEVFHGGAVGDSVVLVGLLRIQDVLDPEERLVEAAKEVFQTGSIDPDGLLIVMMVLIVVKDTVVVEGETLDIVVAFQVGAVPVGDQIVGVRVVTTVVLPPVTVTKSISFR